jgi:hypothetical protein
MNTMGAAVNAPLVDSYDAAQRSPSPDAGLFDPRDIYATHAVATSPVGSQEGISMAEDDIHDLMNARAALAKKRLSWAKTIASEGDAPESTIKAIIELQQAIEVIDITIEELEEAELEELDEEESGDEEEEE